MHRLHGGHPAVFRVTLGQPSKLAVLTPAPLTRAALVIALLATACGSPDTAGLGDRDALAARVIAAAPEGSRTLLVDAFGRGRGTVATSPEVSLRCEERVRLCWAYVSDQTSVTLTSQPDAVSDFVGWWGHCSGNGTCVLSMNATRAVMAKFEPKAFTVRVSPWGDGRGTITSDVGHSCSVAGDSGCAVGVANTTPPRQVTLTATAAPDSELVGWSGYCQGRGADCTVALTGDLSVGAYFKPKAYTLTVSVQGDGSGRVTSGSFTCEDQACRASVPRAQPTTLTATATGDSAFVGWAGACSGTGTCTVTPQHDTTVIALFGTAVQGPTATHLLGGTISGLTGAGLVLATAGQPELPIAAGATSFAFATPLATGTPYAVTVSRQPEGQTCSVEGGSGVMSDSDVSIVVLCGAAAPSGGAFTVTGSMARARYYHTATLLPSGDVLVAAGFDTSAGGTYLATAEIYDAAAMTFRDGGSSSTGRADHSATLLADGSVLIAGGTNFQGRLSSAEVYQPATGTFAPTGSLTAPRFFHTAVLLATGKVLVVGGLGDDLRPVRTVEAYDPSLGGFQPHGSLILARDSCSVTLLADGRVLVAGGVSQETAELYDPASGTSVPTGRMRSARYDHTATLLPDGKVLIAGGIDERGRSTSAEIFDPATGHFTPTGSLSTARNAHSAAMLKGGTVLIVGGDGADSNQLASAEIYDPSTGTFAEVAPMSVARRWAAAVALPDGTALISGGLGWPTGSLASAELFTP